MLYFITVCRSYKPFSGSGLCLTCGNCEPGFRRVSCGGASGGSCVGIECEVLPDVEHASVITTNAGLYPSTATYSCDEGYELYNSGHRILLCEIDGSWDGHVPRCIGVACTALSILNGVVVPSGTIRHPNSAGMLFCPFYSIIPSSRIIISCSKRT